MNKENKAEDQSSEYGLVGMNDMNLEHLKQFMMVAETHNLTKVAEKCFTSPSTVSRNIMKLEESLGVQLLKRNTHSVEMTKAGEVLYSRGKKLDREIDNIEKEVSAVHNFQDSLHIHCASLYWPSLFECIGDFFSDNPDIEPVLCQSDPGDIVRAVERKQINCGITYSFALDNSLNQFDVLPLTKGDFCVLVSKKHPLAKMKVVRPEDIVKTQAITILRQNTPAVDKVCMNSGLFVERENVIAVDTFTSLMLQVRTGRGFALLPKHSTEPYDDCVQLELKNDSTYFVVCFWPRSTDDETTLKFVEYLRGWVRNENKGRISPVQNDYTVVPGTTAGQE